MASSSTSPASSPALAAAAASEALPPLSSQDQDLLIHLLTSPEDPLLIARSRGLSFTEFLAWEQRPEIQQAFADYRALQKRLAIPIIATAKRTLITSLVDIVRNTEDQVERRRASALLLRALRPPRRRVPRTPDSSLSPTSSAGRGGRVLDGGEGCESSSRASAARPSTPADSPRTPSARQALIQADPLASLLKPDGSLDHAAFNTLADEIDRELDEDLDTEIDADDDAIIDDQDDADQDEGDGHDADYDSNYNAKPRTTGAAASSGTGILPVSSQPTPAPATKNSTSATVLQSDPALLSPSFSAPSASSAFSPSRPAHSPSYQRPRKRFQVRRQPSGWLSLGPSNFFLGTCCPSAHHVLSSPLRRRRRTGRYPPRPRSRPG